MNQNMFGSVHIQNGKELKINFYKTRNKIRLFLVFFMNGYKIFHFIYNRLNFKNIN